MLNNLISNAIKFTKNSAKILSNKKVGISYFTEGKWIWACACKKRLHYLWANMVKNKVDEGQYLHLN